MKTLLLLLIIFNTTTIMAQNDLQKLRQGAREVKNTAREVKVATRESKAMASEFKGNQEKDESSPAKSYIKKFWEYVGKMEAAPNDVNILGTNSRAAGTTITNIKMKDKSYNIAPLEEEWQKWNQVYEDVKNGRATQRDATTDVMALLNTLYQVNTNIAQPEIEAKLIEIENYKLKIKELESLNLDPTDKVNVSMINNLKPRIVVELKTINENVKRWETNMNMIVEEIPARAYYHMIEYEYAHWDALRKGPFVEKPQLEEGFVQVDQLLKRLGSLENVIARGKEKAAELIKKTKMPTALVQNSEVEKLFRQAFIDSGWKGVIMKINLLDRDWKAIRHEVTGVLEARTQRAALAVKVKEGEFILYHYFTIQQDYLGNAFSNQAKIIFYESTPILEENIR